LPGSAQTMSSTSITSSLWIKTCSTTEWTIAGFYIEHVGDHASHIQLVGFHVHGPIKSLRTSSGLNISRETRPKIQVSSQASKVKTCRYAKSPPEKGEWARSRCPIFDRPPGEALRGQQHIPHEHRPWVLPWAMPVDSLLSHGIGSTSSRTRASPTPSSPRQASSSPTWCSRSAPARAT
jgi:hypothetical protein